MSVRSEVKAIIVQDNKVLLNKCFDKVNGYYYSLPGGGQDSYESLNETLIKRCLEQTGNKVIPVRFSALCEEICDSAITRGLYPDEAHKVFHIFLCKLEEAVETKEIDDMELGFTWVDINNLGNIYIQPGYLNGNIQKLINEDVSMFLGSKHIANDYK